MTIINPDKVSEIIKEAAAIHILPRYKALEDHEVSSKTNPHDLVTHADIEAEKHLAGILPNLLPGSILIGEESVSIGESSIEVLKDTSQKVWVVDPVDGTHNFVHHKPEFGVMVACVIDGITQYGWIYDVLKDEVYVTEKGSGAYKDDQRLRVPELAGLNEMTAHVNYKFFPKEFRPHIKEQMTIFSEAFSIGSAAHEYTRIASGQSHLALYSRLKPWDHLPGALLVQEAGGYVAKWDKGPYTPQDDYAGLIITTSQDLWEEAYHHFFDGIDLSKYL